MPLVVWWGLELHSLYGFCLHTVVWLLIVRSVVWLCVWVLVTTPVAHLRSAAHLLLLTKTRDVFRPELAADCSLARVLWPRMRQPGEVCTNGDFWLERVVSISSDFYTGTV